VLGFEPTTARSYGHQVAETSLRPKNLRRKYLQKNKRDRARLLLNMNMKSQAATVVGIVQSPEVIETGHIVSLPTGRHPLCGM